MNYRTMLRGALALSLGLIVGTASAEATSRTDIQKYGATFESAINTTAGQLNDYAYEEGTNITKYAVTTGNPSGWFGAAEDESKIIAANGGQALQLNTDAGTLTNKLESSKAAEINAGIAGTGAYIETEAKFVASDTLDAGIVGGTDDTKFAIYAYADENASPCTTNLVVYHAYEYTDQNEDVVKAFTNEVFATLIDCDVYTKLRVEMKRINVAEEGEPASYQNVFSVSINDGEPLSSPLAKVDGVWFQTVEMIDNVDNTQLASVNFKGTGEVDNLSVGIIQQTTTYTVNWAGSDGVVVSNATAQIEGTTTNVAPNTGITFYPTEGNVITNVLVGGVAQPFDPASYSITVNSDTNLVVLAGTQAAPATVISVATVGNATVTDNQDGTYTISVPLGNGLSSVFVNGAAVDPSLLTEGQGGTYTLDLSGASGTVNVVVATKKVRTPIGHKWWENPGVKATTVVGKGGDAGPYRFSVGSDFAAISYGNHQAATTGFKLFTVDSLLAGNASPIYNEVVGDTTSLNIYSVRGAAICEALDVALITAYSGGKAFSLPLSTNELELGVNAFEITNDQGITFDRAYFSADNQYLYTTEVDGGTNTKIAKWAIADGLKGSGQKLTLVTEYTMPARVRDFAYAVINNKELFYVLQNGKAGVCVYDVAAGTSTQLTDALVDGGNYGSVAVSMTSTSTPTLTFLPSMTDSNTDPMKVYQLAADGLSVVQTLATFTTADLVAAGITAGSYIRSAWPSEDDETLYLGYGNNNLYVLQYVEPPALPTIITVAQTIGAHGGSISNGNFQAVAGVATPITITADQGYVIAQIVTNGAPVAAALGETSVTFDAVFSDAEGANNSIIATFAKDNAWFVDPFIRNEYAANLANEGVQTAALDEGNGVVVFGRSASAGTSGQLSYNLADLTNDFGKITTPLHTEAENSSLNGEYWGRSIAAVPPFSATIACNYINGYATVLPYEGTWIGENADSYTVQFNMGESGLSVPHLYPVAANKAGTFLYGVDTAGSKIYKFAIVADAQDNTKIGSLQYVASWDFTGGGDLKGIGVGTFNGNDVVYMSKNASRGLWTLDVATGTLTKTGAAIDCEVYDIIVTGQAAGTPRLVVAGGVNIFVYDLAADGTLLVDTPVFKATAASLYSKFTANTRLGVVAVDDETRIVLGTGGPAQTVNAGKVTVSVIECKPANLIVRGTFDDGATTDDRSVAFGAAANETFTAPAGQTISAVTVNGVAQAVADGATSFTYEAAELTEYVYIDMQSVEPQYTATYTGSENVIITNTYDGSSYEWGEGEAVVPTQIACLSGTVLSFYPTEGNVITNVTIGGVEQTGFDPACYSITVISDTNIVVLAGVSQPIGRIKPEWAADADTTKFWNWVDNNSVSDYASVDYTTEYLLNIAPQAGVTPELKIVSIAVGASATTIEVTCTAGRLAVDLANLNGVLNVAVGSSVTALTPKAIPAANLDASTSGWATITIPNGDGCFFRARVDFAAPQASLTAVSE